ncbi:MAG: hypothetical protein DRJ63_07105 [Thermoprotei archaeon]|nr:MAG: hypothetical protein DRJ63_07105 [Thermoprotei archaeon]
MKWSELPEAARRYIIYHTVTSVTLFTWFMLPYYVLVSGMKVWEAGLLFTIIEALGIPISYFLGRVFTYVDARKGVALIELLEGLARIAYGMAYGVLGPLFLMAGMILDETASYFYPVYSIYERNVYPGDEMKSALSWHLRLPELSILVSYPVWGVVLGVLCTGLSCIRLGFIFAGAVSIVLAAIVMVYLHSVRIVERKDEKVEVSLSKVYSRLKLYLVIEIVFTLAWSIAPTLALVYYIIEVYGGNLLHIALVEASISLATVTATYIVDRISEEKSFEALQMGTLLVVFWVLSMVLSLPFIFLLAMFYIARLGDTIVYVFKKKWYFSLISEKEVAMVEGSLRSLKTAIWVLSPLVAGALAYINPRLPYLVSLALFILLIVLYGVAKLRESSK